MAEQISRSTRTTTVRLDEAQLEALAAMATVHRGSVAEEIRQAVAARIDERRQDPEFQARLSASIERTKQAFHLADQTDSSRVPARR